MVLFEDNYSYSQGYADGKRKGLEEAATAYMHIEEKTWAMDPNGTVCKCSPCVGLEEAVAAARAALIDARRNDNGGAE